MQFFENNKVYTPKEVMSRMNISRITLMKYCDNGLNFITLPGSTHRRFEGDDLNNFFKKTEWNIIFGG